MTSLETNLRTAFQTANEQQLTGLASLLALYHEDVFFEDPHQRTHGKEALARFLRQRYSKLREVELQLLSFSSREQEAHTTWTLRFRPRIGPRIQIDGASYLQLRDGKILSQRDYWDLLSSLIETSPFIAIAYQTLWRKIL